MSEFEIHDHADEHFDEEETEEVPFFCRLTFGQFFTLIVLVVITICCSFYLGARYGNDYLRIEGSAQHATAKVPALQPKVSPSVGKVEMTRIQRRALEDDKLKKMARRALWKEQQQKLEEQVQEYLDTPQPAVPANTETRNAPRTPSELAAERINEVDELLKQASAARQLTPPAPPPQTAPPASRAPQQQPTTVTPATPKLEPQPTREVALTELGGASGLPYAVQVGAYRNYQEANTRLKEWKAKGYPAYLMSADLPGSGRWYRIRFGAFATRVDAKSYLGDLSTRESVDGIIVVNE